jgi:hypothetical protein
VNPVNLDAVRGFIALKELAMPALPTLQNPAKKNKKGPKLSPRALN